MPADRQIHHRLIHAVPFYQTIYISAKQCLFTVLIITSKALNEVSSERDTTVRAPCPLILFIMHLSFLKLHPYGNAPKVISHCLIRVLWTQIELH